MRQLIGFLFCAVALSFTGCNAPFVQAKKPKKMYIASDFLEAKDSTLFNDFYTKTGVKIYILPLSFDSIRSKFEKDPFTTKFDLVFLKSTYTLSKAVGTKMLHPVAEYETLQHENLIAPSHDWIVLGIDPYVVAGVNQGQDFQYNELTYGPKWTQSLSDEEMACFQASVLHQFGRNNRSKSLSWLEKIKTQTEDKSDSTISATYYLTKLSHVLPTKTTFTYPNQTKKYGAFYDALGIGIVKHSRNYTSALAFISFYSTQTYNQKITKRLHVLPATNPNGTTPFDYQKEYPILYRCSPNDAVSQFRDLNRIKNRLSNSQTTTP